MPSQTALTRPAICLLLCGWVATVSAAGSGPGKLYPTDFSARVGLGVEYDSNVSVDEVDITSSESDYALILDTEFRVRQRFSEKTEGSLTYDLNQSRYQEFSLVNRQTHMIGGDLDTKVNGARAGLSAYYIHSRLDNDPFLTLIRLSPSLSGFVSKKFFLRGAYVYSDKGIEENSERDAITHTGEADLYYFHRGLRSYINIGYKYKDENARIARLDYSSHNFKARYVLRFDIFDRLAKGEVSWRFEDRDYRSITESIMAKRRDKRHRWGLNLEIPLEENSLFQLYYGYGDYDSNYPSSDYNQDVLGMRFIYTWD